MQSLLIALFSVGNGEFEKKSTFVLHALEMLVGCCWKMAPGGLSREKKNVQKKYSPGVKMCYADQRSLHTQ